MEEDKKMKESPKIGDIFRWGWNSKTLKEYENKLVSGTLYWCCSNICVFKDDGRFHDTYWGTISSNKSFSIEDARERLTLEYIGNFDDLVEASEDDRAYYEDKDCVDLSHANMTRGGFYLRIGAIKSLDKMRRVMKRNIRKLQLDADYAQQQADNMRKELDSLKITLYAPTIKDVNLMDSSYEDGEI